MGTRKSKRRKAHQRTHRIKTLRQHLIKRRREPCQHQGGVKEHYYGYKCADCGEFLYPYGCEPWIDADEEELEREALLMEGRCFVCGGEWGDGWSTCRCNLEEAEAIAYAN